MFKQIQIITICEPATRMVINSQSIPNKLKSQNYKLEQSSNYKITKLQILTIFDIKQSHNII